MANDRLRTAMLAAGLTVEEMATKVGVDPKTAERWIGQERVPHRSTRQKLTKLLGVNEGDLWPSLGTGPRPAAPESELLYLYPSRSAITGATWEELIHGVREQMDVLVFSGAFLVEQYNLVPIIQSKAAEGVRFRLLVGDEKAPAVIQRAIDEGTPGGLEGRVQLMRRYLSEVTHLPGVEVRTHGTILYNSIYRFDDRLLVNGHAHGALAGQSPVLFLKRMPNGPMWQHYMKSFERVWNEAQPES
ncbi:Transcriptional regulator, contains XRE-family HTH domain [Amycolatopsis sacchari]|uniref:Transcriptional regulator, contains XRE-family HTH domain n=1 Tax=Amycolatopsis sacchari TaxID=115433 RepID=A0A1I4A8Z1_9PSEU|nr:helix-turn-helix transcriptional regulator [Amycolatopsis sacchari]SFK52784.1 Transcriptional regulator, contains XRE-family HTH domain [Amycolatopsis sacchari]